MRFLSLLLIPATMFAQSATTTYQTDVNGRRTPVVTQDQSAKGDRTQRTQTVNGRQVPLEQSTERIVSDDGNGKVVERITQKFDPTGRPVGTERVTIEETTLPGGGKLVKQSTAVSELNGGYRPVDRRTTETRVSGQTTTTNVTVDKPGLNQAFQTAEKRNIVTVGATGKQQTTEVVERTDVSGRFRPVERNETSVQVTGDKTTQNTATYETNVLGKLSLSKQTVATTTKGPAGDVTETNVYAVATMGKTQQASDKLQLQEQRVSERKVGTDGSVTEVVNVRHPNPSDPSKLAEPQRVSETVCTGKCLPAAPVAAANAPAAVAAAPKPPTATKK